MNDGAVQQVGTPQEIYHDPTNVFVGTFIGSPPLNLHECTLEERGGQLIAVSELFSVPIPPEILKKEASGEPHAQFAIRPEFVTIAPQSEISFPARVNLIEPLGSRTVIFLQANETEIRSVVQGDAPIKEGEAVHIKFDMKHAFLFDGSGDRM
jgi:multiple sugar transport system ATP-binding protein